MIELLITLLVVGFCIYYFCRHPVKSAKIVGGTIGLLLLGVIGIGAFALMCIGLLEWLS